MSSKSNRNIRANSAGEEEKTTEVVSLVFASIMIFVGLLVTLLNLRFTRRVATRRKHPNIKKLRRKLLKARLAVKTGMLSATETVILAIEAGMTLEDVRLEYVNSHVPKEEILESVFGKLADNFFNRLKLSGRFMETGYANEKVFLDLWESESYRETVMLQNREESKTQTMAMTIEDPAIPIPPVPNAPTQTTAQTAQTTQTTKTSQDTPANPDSSPDKKTGETQKRQGPRDGKKGEGLPFLCKVDKDDAH